MRRVAFARFERALKWVAGACGAQVNAVEVAQKVLAAYDCNTDVNWLICYRANAAEDIFTGRNDQAKHRA